MTIINSSPLLSGLAVQQKYSASKLAGARTTRPQAGTSISSSGDTVQISARARELFRSQTANNATEARVPDKNTLQAAVMEKTTPTATAIFFSRVSIEEQISQLETEISGLMAEIAMLEEKAATDDLAAILLRSKQGQLQALQAKLMGLRAESLLSK